MSADSAAICRACRVSPQYLRAKTRIKERLSRIPGGGTITRAVSRFKAKIKRAVPADLRLFEQWAFTYLGPVDGHDLKSVCEFIALAKKMKKNRFCCMF